MWIFWRVQEVLQVTNKSNRQAIIGNGQIASLQEYQILCVVIQSIWLQPGRESDTESWKHKCCWYHLYY